MSIQEFTAVLNDIERIERTLSQLRRVTNDSKRKVRALVEHYNNNRQEHEQEQVADMPMEQEPLNVTPVRRARPGTRAPRKTPRIQKTPRTPPMKFADNEPIDEPTDGPIDESIDIPSEVATEEPVRHHKTPIMLMKVAKHNSGISRAKFTKNALSKSVALQEFRCVQCGVLLL